MSNTYANAADLLGSKRRFDVVHVSGRTVRIQSLSELEKSEIDAAAIDYKKGAVKRQAAQLSRARLICACVVDGEGNRVFDTDDRTVRKVAHEMDSRDSDQIYRACVSHVGGIEDDFEELVGNSAETTGDASQSD